LARALASIRREWSTPNETQPAATNVDQYVPVPHPASSTSGRFEADVRRETKRSTNLAWVGLTYPPRRSS
jgi:hypothetical protein